MDKTQHPTAQAVAVRTTYKSDLEKSFKAKFLPRSEAMQATLVPCLKQKLALLRAGASAVEMSLEEVYFLIRVTNSLVRESTD